jgi:ligand-binding sensor domain-containing protein/signal transduction histidine kinase
VVAKPELQNTLSARTTRLAAWLLILAGAVTYARADDGTDTFNQTMQSRVQIETLTLPVTEGKDIRFKRLFNSQGLSQVRVSDIVQDGQGFLWFGTWNGLNRYDGYKFKVFKHEPGRADSLSGVYVYSLLKDRTGAIWVGTDQFLDRFDPITEKFTHYRFVQDFNGLPTPVGRINEDSSGMLWLSTRNGLFEFNPTTGEIRHFRHNPDDPSSLGDSDIKCTGEDRTGTFWVGTSQTLDEFDRRTGKVKRHVPLGESGVGLWFHEDRFGVFWIIYGSDGRIATLDRNANKLIRYEFDWKRGSAKRNNQAYAMLEDHQGTMWFGTGAAGLLKFDREHRRFISYSHRPYDPDSLADNRVTASFEDREGNIWVGLHQAEPNFFATEPLPFENLTHESDNPSCLSPGLVATVYEDRNDVLWVGVDRVLKRIDRKTGKCSTFHPADGSEVLSIIEDGADTLWLGNAGPGLLRYNRRTGDLRGYRDDPTNPASLCSGVTERLLIDHTGKLWAATWDGLCGFNSSSQKFTTYKPDPKTRGLNYYAIAEDSHGNLWLGGNLGLHRFDPNTSQFTVYNHNLDDPKSLSDNRVNSVHFDHTGTMWVGTQNGLDKFDSKTNTFAVYDERQGMAGNAVSCILEDKRGLLWMSTNKGISSFNSQTERFANYTAADGLPGPDLTGWGACYQSATGEMFFGGFSGLTAFYPDRVGDSTYAPQVVLTDFRLFGKSVVPGASSTLKSAVNYTRAVRLSSKQSIFSIEFSALSFFNTPTNRYRYKLDGLDNTWHEVGSDERLATYTTLPAGTYTFRVEAATSHGPWGVPGAVLVIDILPPIWKTAWFLTACAALICILVWMLHRARLKRFAHQFNMRLEERVHERTRIARELHDTLLQTIQGSKLVADEVLTNLSGPIGMRRALERVSDWMGRATEEGRAALTSLRTSTTQGNDLTESLQRAIEECRLHSPIEASFAVAGETQGLHPVVRDEVFRIGYEAIRNACAHSHGSRTEVEVTYAYDLTLRVADNGVGIDPAVLDHGKGGRFGLQGMRERTARIGAKLTIVSSPNSGTQVTLVVPGRIAFRTGDSAFN